LNTSVKQWLGIGQGTLIGADYMISPYIGGGYLNIVNGKNSVVIDPTGFGKAEGVTKHDIFKITTTKGEAVKIDTDGNASFAGTITSSDATITGGSIIIKNSNDEVVFNAGPTGVTIGGYAKSSDLPNMNNYATKGEIPSVAGLMSASATGSYSWDFSTSKGIKMWNTSDTSKDFVFGVNSSGVYVNGEVVANKGRIG
jgi:hypothetical protein